MQLRKGLFVRQRLKTKISCYTRWVASTFAIAICGVTAAQPSAADVKRVLADPAAVAAAAQAGQRSASFCFNCHGDSGHSKIPETPNLAGQNAVYLLEQIRKFAAGERRDPFMQGLVKVLSDEERLNIALYFSTQKARPASDKPGPQAAAGQAVFNKVCLACHGEQGYGKEEIPRIAGQQSAYLHMALKAYRDKAGDRTDPRMGAVTANLSDADISALAAYVSALR